MIFNTIEKELANFHQLQPDPDEKSLIDYGVEQGKIQLKPPTSPAFTPVGKSYHQYILQSCTPPDQRKSNVNLMKTKKVLWPNSQSNNIQRDQKFKLYQNKLLNNHSKSETDGKSSSIQISGKRKLRNKNQLISDNSTKNYSKSQKCEVSGIAESQLYQLSPIHFNKYIAFQDKQQPRLLLDYEDRTTKSRSLSTRKKSSLTESCLNQNKLETKAVVKPPLQPKVQEKPQTLKIEATNVETVIGGNSENEAKVIFPQTYSQNLWIALLILSGLTIVFCQIVA